MQWRSKLMVRPEAALAVAALIAVPVFSGPAPSFGTTFEIERVDGDSTSLSGYVGLAVDGDADPHLIYGYDAESARYARKTGGAWTYERLDFAFFAEGGYPSIECDGAGASRIIYQANNVETPMYVRKSGALGPSNSPQVLRNRACSTRWSSTHRASRTSRMSPVA